jgi:NAD-dependent SIR2 family protein deacetylase
VAESDLSARLEEAASRLRAARALVVAAGAGMGVDSGLPDFRSEGGFWRAYLAYARLGISFYDMATPDHFERDPAFAWGFYGHRLDMYRRTVPHDGFQILLNWRERFALDTFVVTSNVDGQFQRAGFPDDRVCEAHGSIHHLQCTRPCSSAIDDNYEDVPVDADTMRASRVPRCPRCGAVARPNVLMFSDADWISARTDAQHGRLIEFLRAHAADPLVVIEIGAGLAVPTIRRLTESLAMRTGVFGIRMNPREAEISPPHLSLPCNALDGLRGIDAALGLVV